MVEWKYSLYENYKLEEELAFGPSGLSSSLSGTNLTSFVVFSVKYFILSFDEMSKTAKTRIIIVVLNGKS